MSWASAIGIAFILSVVNNLSVRQTKPNQIKPNQTKSSQTKSNQIKSNQTRLQQVPDNRSSRIAHHVGQVQGLFSQAIHVHSTIDNV
jgi:hypothetical protein